jgi:phage terminase small subunit
MAKRKDETPLEFMLRMMNDPKQTAALRARMAVAAAQYVHVRRHDGGKRESEKNAAKRAAAGKFAPARPPKGGISR